MSKYKFLKWILLFVFTFNINNMNAQENKLIESHLTNQQQSIISISSLTAKGDLKNLKIALNKGLEAGLTVNEIKEMLVHTYAYCGFPRSIRGLQTFMEVLNERKAKGVNDNLGKEAAPIKSDATKYERGKAILGELNKMPQPDKLGGYSAFAPIIDTFLKEHLFADIFERDVLTYAQRELVTISVIAAIGDAEPMLRSHFAISLNTGISLQQLEEFISIIKRTAGKDKAKSAKKVLESITQG